VASFAGLSEPSTFVSVNGNVDLEVLTRSGDITSATAPRDGFDSCQDSVEQFMVRGDHKAK